MTKPSCSPKGGSSAVLRARTARIRTSSQSTPYLDAAIALTATENALHKLLDAPSWQETKRCLEAHEDLLLEPLAPALLTVWIHRAEEAKTPVAQDAGRYLRWHRRLLWRAMQQDIATAWAIEIQYWNQ